MGGNPTEPFNVAGRMYPKYKVVIGTIGLFYVVIKSVGFYNSTKPEKTPITSEAEDKFVHEYVEQWKASRKIPRWIRGERDVFIAPDH